MSDGLSSAKIIQIADEHFDEVMTIWEELIATNDGATMRDAVVEFIKRQEAKTSQPLG